MFLTLITNHLGCNQKCLENWRVEANTGAEAEAQKLAYKHFETLFAT